MDSALTSGNYTVFAPTDAAFAKLPAGTVDALLKDKTRLSQILVRCATRATSPQPRAPCVTLPPPAADSGPLRCSLST